MSFPLGSGIRTCPAGRTLLLTSFAIRILRILILLFQSKKDTLKDVFSAWQRYKDSNLNIRSQSPLCYRYTIPLRTSAIILSVTGIVKCKL